MRLLTEGFHILRTATSNAYWLKSSPSVGVDKGFFCFLIKAMCSLQAWWVRISLCERCGQIETAFKVWIRTVFRRLCGIQLRWTMPKTVCDYFNSGYCYFRKFEMNIFLNAFRSPNFQLYEIQLIQQRTLINAMILLVIGDVYAFFGYQDVHILDTLCEFFLRFLKFFGFLFLSIYSDQNKRPTHFCVGLMISNKLVSCCLLLILWWF